jgi:hypothetical protein
MDKAIVSKKSKEILYDLELIIKAFKSVYGSCELFIPN